MPTISVNGVQLFVEQAGTQGPPLLLVHGSWGDHHNWDAVVPALSKSFRVVIYDRRGHSQSERLATQGGIEEDADDLAELARTLGIVPAHIIGNSFGASIALRAAIRHRDIFASLVVHEPPLFGLLPSTDVAVKGFQQRVNAIIAMFQRGNSRGGAEQFVETIALGPGMWQQLPDAMRETFVFNAPTWLDEMQEPAAMTMDVTQLAGFDRLALLTKGTQSPPLFGRVMEKLAKALPRHSQHTFAGAGHMPHVTHPNDYVRVVSRFVLRSVMPA
jgi:pimeloyl-ACP methyl ester carboxylesterase